MFDKSLMNLEVLHQTMLSFKEMFLLNFWKQPLKGVLKTDRKMPVTESIFKNYNFSKEKQTNKQTNKKTQQEAVLFFPFTAMYLLLSTKFLV